MRSPQLRSKCLHGRFTKSISRISSVSAVLGILCCLATVTLTIDVGVTSASSASDVQARAGRTTLPTPQILTAFGSRIDPMSSVVMAPSLNTSKFAIVTNQISGPQGRATIVDLTTNPPSIVAEVSNLDQALSAAITPDGTRALVNGVVGSSNAIFVIDLTANPPVVSSTVVIGGTVTNFDISMDGTKAVACNNSAKTIAIVDLTANPPVISATVPVGSGLQGSPRAAIFTADGDYALVGFGDGSVGQLLVVDLALPTPAEILSERIPIGKFPIGMGTDPERSLGIVTSIVDNNVTILDLSTFPISKKATVAVGLNPGSKPDISRGGLAVVPNSDGDTVSIVDAAAATPGVIATVPVGQDPRGAAVIDVDNTALVANRQDGTLSRISLDTFSAITLPLSVPLANHVAVHEPPACASDLSIDGYAPDFCEDEAIGISVTLNGNNLSETTVQWSLTGPDPNPNLGNGLALSTMLIALTPGNYSLVATVSKNGCPDVIATRDFVVRPKPEAHAGPDQVFCETSSTTLAGNTPAVGIGTWTILHGSATIVEPNNPNTVITDLPYGDTLLRWTVNDGHCSNGDDIVAITRHQPPTPADAGPDQSFCETSTTTLTANVPAVGDAYWQLVSGSATITDPFSATTTVTDIGYGTHLFQWVTNNGSCQSSIDQMTVTRYQTPPTANAGPDVELCETSILAISANEPTAGSGMWTIVSGGGTIDNPNHFAATISNLPYGETILRWTITNGDCAATSDEMRINRSQTPTAVAGANQTLCETDSTTMAATTPSSGTGTWTLVSGTGTIVEPNNPETLITGLGYGENRFRWRVTNGSCPPSGDVVKITRDQAPTVAVAGPNQNFCETSSTTLAANTPVVGTGTWILVSGSGTITDPDNPHTTVTNLAYGATILRWRIRNGSCGASADNVKLTRYETPTTANAGPDQTFCDNTETMLAGNQATVGTGTWILVSGSGTILEPNNPNTIVTALGYGTNVFRWRIDNGSCAASTDRVNIVRNQCSASSNYSQRAYDLMDKLYDPNLRHRPLFRMLVDLVAGHLFAAGNGT